MKKIFTILAIALFTTSAYSQAPEKMSYQAVIRNASNSLVVSSTVGMQISILQGSATGTAVYVETHAPSTNANGLVSVQIGQGTLVSGSFSTINWANGPFFIKTETDPTGGTSYTITGTSQFLSVPYALHSNTADSIVGGINITETDPFFGASISKGITALDTANWNNHSVDTDTQLDSLGIAGFGYVAGPHTVDTDTQLDSLGVKALGFVAGPHTIDTDTQLDSTGIAGFGYVAGSHTLDTDTQLDSLGIAVLGFVAGPHTIDTDTQLDSTGIAALGYEAGEHFVDSLMIGNFVAKVKVGSHSFFDVTSTNEMYNFVSQQNALVGVSKDNHNPIETNDTRAFMAHNDGKRNLTKTVVCEPGELTISVQNDSIGALNQNPFQAVIQMYDARKQILIGNAYERPDQNNAFLLAENATALYYTGDEDSTFREFVFHGNGLELGKNDTTVFSVEMNGTTTIGEVLKLKPSPSAPSSPVKGTVYFNGTTNKLMVFDGTVWQACW